jgi:hypothetical protein
LLNIHFYMDPNAGRVHAKIKVNICFLTNL